jgi:CheY-like chemotaxis protein
VRESTLADLWDRVAHIGGALVAVDACHQVNPQLVLLDIGMPDLNGYEVCRLIRAEPSFADIFIVATTGFAGHEDRQKSATAGFNVHLVKPVRLEQLQAVLENVSRGVHATASIDGG